MPKSKPTIQAPDVRRSPSVWTGLTSSDPRFRGKEPDAINAMLPRYASFEEAIEQMGGSDAEKTMRLQEVYGLPRNYDVRNGRLVEHKRALKGIALGAGMLVGMHGLDKLINGATALTAGGSAATLGPSTSANIAATTAAAAPPASLAASTESSMAGKSGVLGWLGKIFKGGDTANRVLDLGRTIAGAGSEAAQNRQQQAQILAQLFRTQADIAKQQTDAAREAQDMGIARAQIGRQLDLTAPTVSAPSGVRMGSIQMPTLPASTREALLAQLNKPIPDYVPPTMPNIDPGKMEQILGAIGLGTTMAGQVFGGTDRAFPQTQAQRRPILDPDDMTAQGLPPAPSIRFPVTR